MKVFIVLVFFAAFFVKDSIQVRANAQEIAAYLAKTTTILNEFNQTLTYIRGKNSDATFSANIETRYSEFMNSLAFTARVWRLFRIYAPLSPHLEKYVSQLKRFCDLLSGFGVNKAYTLVYYFYVTHIERLKRFDEEFVYYGTGAPRLDLVTMDASRVKTTNANGDVNAVFDVQRESQATSIGLQSLVFNDASLTYSYFYFINSIVFTKLQDVLTLSIPSTEETQSAAIAARFTKALNQSDSLHGLFDDSMPEPQNLRRRLVAAVDPGTSAVWVMMKNL